MMKSSIPFGTETSRPTQGCLTQVERPENGITHFFRTHLSTLLGGFGQRIRIEEVGGQGMH